MTNLLEWIINYVSNNLFLSIFGFLTAYQVIYLVVGFLSKKKTYPATNVINNYGVVIAARNESLVIERLIESILLQDYPKNKITIFVVADNCTDNTATLARNKGAIVYERFDDSKKRKGWALEYLFTKIHADYDKDYFDGFIFFDADNLVDKNYVKEINKAFVVNKNIVVGYRNVKNFDTNFISSAYGIHFYRSILSLHRPRNQFKLGTHIAGTGFVLSSKLLADGWNYHSLTEDTELTINLAIKGIKISFCEDAIFYDEQPTDLITAYRQRLRWTSGRLFVFLKYGPKLFFNIFKKLSFTLYDLFFYLFPLGFYTLFTMLIIPIIIGVFNQEIITLTFWSTIGEVLLGYVSSGYVTAIITALFVVIRENKNIHASLFKKIMAIITFAWFDLVNILLSIGVILKPNVKWTTIKHDDQRSIDDIKK